MGGLGLSEGTQALFGQTGVKVGPRVFGILLAALAVQYVADGALGLWKGEDAMLSIRAAQREDVPLIRQLVRELAEYERDPDAAVLTEADLLRDGFGETPCFHVRIADWDGAPVGFALYFFNYSTWQGRPGLYLEDLFVRPSHRGRGIGRALLRDLAQVAVERNCGRLAWQVLDWNEPSLGFYRSIGARVLDGWLTMRLEGPALQRLVLADPPPVSK